MTEDGRFGGTSETAAPRKPANQDFGYFAPAAATPHAAPSQFGGPPAQVSPPASAMPPPASAMPPQPAPNQFGPPPSPVAPAWQGGPPPASGPQPYPYPPGPRRGLPAWAIVAICVPAVVVVVGILAAIAIPVFLNQRSTPVMPASVRGIPRTTDPSMTQSAAQVRDRLRQENPSAKIDAAGYGTGSSGYLLVGANLRLNPAQEFSSLGSADGPTVFGETQCATNTESHVSLCLHTGTRGSVELLALGGSELSQLATDTATVWSAQPFGG